MALQLTHTVKGVTMTNAYHKVRYVSGNKEKLHIDIQVSASSSDEPLDNFSFVLPSESMYHTGDASDVNYTKQAYEFMKSGVFSDLSGSIKDYTTATDV